MKRSRLWFALVAITATVHAQTVVREWRPDELVKWHGGMLENLRVENGALVFDAKPGDAMLVSPPFEGFPATPWQRIEVTMKSDVAGACNFFWSGTTHSKFGGFAPEKHTPFESEAGGFHTYQVEPFWQAEKKIILLRLSVPHDRGGHYAIQSLRVVETAPPSPVPLPVGDVAPDAVGEWRARVAIRAEDFSFVTLRLSADAGGAGTLSFASSGRNGLKTLHFPLRADGRTHTYNLDTGAAMGSGPAGEIIALRLKPSNAAGAKVKIESIAVGSDIAGPADLELAYVGLSNAFARAGRPERIEAVVRNNGGEPARVKPQLTLSGACLAGKEPAAADVENGLPMTFAWTVKADKAGPASATVSLDGAAPVTAALEFKAPLRLPKADYVPKPQPAKSDYQVGVYYFPGWQTASRWAPIKAYPERQPLLGWYREGDPEVADWQIKWAVEHGINFFLYDWYWDRSRRHLEHGIHDALFHARYQNLIKFCLLYANHNPPGSHSAEDFEQIAQFWIDNYFRRPNYLRIQGKPVVVMFAPMNPARDMGVEAVRRSFDQMRDQCRAAGLGGIYLVACMPPTTGLLPQLKAMGYDAVSCYNWASVNMTAAERQANRASYASCAEGYATAWHDIAAAALLKLIPPVCGGWDARPWHGEGTLARTGRTPELFKRHLVECKQFLDAQEPKSNMLFVEAWNEWGEGSYIEPHREFGFGYLEAIRQVFAPDSPKPAEIAPADLGLGPYDLPDLPLATAWDFTKAADPLGWSGNVVNLRVAKGLLQFTTSGRDPILSSPPTRVAAAVFPSVVLNLKASRDVDGQLFWGKPGVGMSEAASVHFPIRGDGKFHDVKVDLSANPRWRGVITSLRFDPGSEDGVEVAVKSITLEKK
jgi:Glycosyltransferase WbsX